MAACQLSAVFTNYEAEEYSIVSEQTMGFSGAKIQEICIQKWQVVDESIVQEDETPPPNSLFVKHIVFPELDDSVNDVARQKDFRNRLSYTNETNFIEKHIPRLEQTGNFYFPKTYKIFHDIDANETFTFVTKSLTPVAKQYHVFDSIQLFKVLEWTSRLHAVYHGKVDSVEVVKDGALFIDAMARHEETGLWSQGTHLAWEKRPPSEIAKLEKNWSDLCVAFSWPDLEGLGTRLAAAAPYVSQQLSVMNKRNSSRTTLVHGDVKPANIFFLNDDNNSKDGCDIALIDYQWSGTAMAVTEIIYLLASAAPDEFIDAIDLENEVLRPYYSSFTSAYAAQPDNANITVHYSFDELLYDFQLAVLDYVRWAVTCRLGGENPQKYAARREKNDVNLGSYRRSDRMLRFLFDLVSAYLPTVEKEISAL